MKLYLANPLGFTESGWHFLFETLLPRLNKLGFEVINPWEHMEGMSWDSILLETQKLSPEENKGIAHKNEEDIRRADIVLAVLDGVDVDSGVAAEIGFAFAIGKMILGYRGDFRVTGDNPSARVNLQVEWFITSSGGRVARSLSELDKVLSKIQTKNPWVSKSATR